MPKKRPLEIRVVEARERMDRLELEQKIKDLRNRLPARRKPKRR